MCRSFDVSHNFSLSLNFQALVTFFFFSSTKSQLHTSTNPGPFRALHARPSRPRVQDTVRSVPQPSLAVHSPGTAVDGFCIAVVLSLAMMRMYHSSGPDQDVPVYVAYCDVPVFVSRYGVPVFYTHHNPCTELLSCCIERNTHSMGGNIFKPFYSWYLASQMHLARRQHLIISLSL